MTEPHPLQEVTRLRLLAAALDLQHLTSTAANLVPIPGGERVIVIGTRAEVARLMEVAPAAPTQAAPSEQTDMAFALMVARASLDEIRAWGQKQFDAGRAAQGASGAPTEPVVLRKLCDQLDAMKRTMFLRPGTGQNYSYLVHEDVQAYVEQARASLAAPSGASGAQVGRGQADDLNEIARYMIEHDGVGYMRQREDGEYVKLRDVEAVLRAQAASGAQGEPKCKRCNDHAMIYVEDAQTPCPDCQDLSDYDAAHPAPSAAPAQTGQAMYEEWMRNAGETIQPRRWIDLSESTRAYWNKRAIYGAAPAQVAQTDAAPVAPSQTEQAEAHANDRARLDWLDQMANEPEGLLLHDGSRATGRRGLGLRRIGRTLREAIDQAIAQKGGE